MWVCKQKVTIFCNFPGERFLDFGTGGAGENQIEKGHDFLQRPKGKQVRSEGCNFSREAVTASTVGEAKLPHAVEAVSLAALQRAV